MKNATQKKLEAMQAGYSMFTRDNEWDAKASVDIYAANGIDSYRIGATVCYKASETSGSVTARAMEIIST